MLSQTKASVTVKEEVHEIEAEVRLELLPDARIEIHGVLPKGQDFLHLNDIRALVISGKNIVGFATKINSTRFIWQPKSEPIIGLGDQNTEITSVLFHLFNYKEIMGTRGTVEKEGKSAFRISHVDFKASDWSVEIRSLKTSSKTFKALEETGGYGLTHIGRC